MPFTTVVEALQPRRTPGQNPLFQVAFILEPPAPATGSGWTLSQLDVDIGASKFDLTLELGGLPRNLSIVDVDSDPELQRRYGLRVPVLECGTALAGEGRFDVERFRELYPL